MELRFETAPNHAYDLMKTIMREHFPGTTLTILIDPV